jgi:hypothetical protein
MVDDIDGEINRWLKGIVLRLGLDCSIVAEIDASGWGAFTHGWARDRDEIIRQPPGRQLPAALAFEKGDGRGDNFL